MLLADAEDARDLLDPLPENNIHGPDLVSLLDVVEVPSMRVVEYVDFLSLRIADIPVDDGFDVGLPARARAAMYLKGGVVPEEVPLLHLRSHQDLVGGDPFSFLSHLSTTFYKYTLQFSTIVFKPYIHSFIFIFSNIFS